ncbi:hypothetical protein FOL47_001236 [Perkinsus chesapeaki]|uniref:Uncharacterized protein n=1 Tax=Perkinsus chesapeaki TaxID=330153 RepID=A0A7J6KTC6_PERCH|nr:hypothetical protein FOL47_001236 [Perkinsus chesapeaki]
MIVLKKKVPPLALTAREIELYIAAGALDAAEFPDYSLAHKDSELPLVGFEYGRQCSISITTDVGEPTRPLDSFPEMMSEDDLKEEDLVAVLDMEELWEGKDMTSDSPGTDTEEGDLDDMAMNELSLLAEKKAENAAFESPTRSIPSDECLFGCLTETRTPRNVAKRRALTSSPGGVSPSFNDEMQTICLKVLNEFASSHRGDSLTKKCLARYNDFKHQRICLSRTDGVAAPALLDVTYGMADVWIKKQLKLHSLPARESMFDATTRSEMMHLHNTLSAVSSSCEAALQEPVKAADVKILTSCFDGGPKAITSKEVHQEVLKSRGDASEHRSTGERRDEKKDEDLCPYCGLPPDENAHKYDGRSHKYGLCPMKPAVDQSNVTRKERIHVQPGMEERRRRAQANLQLLGGLSCEGKENGRRQRSCSVCDQLWASTFHGIHHQYIGRGAGATFCPFADPVTVLDDYLRKKQEKKREYWRGQNAKRRERALVSLDACRSRSETADVQQEQ